MRRKVCLLIAIFTLLFCMAAYADGCPIHNWLYETEYSTSQPYYTQNNASYHRAVTIHYYECEYCAVHLPAQYWTRETSVTEPHVISSSWDGGHVGETKYHRRYYRCGKCNYEWSSLYSCPGSPCIYPNSNNVTE